MTEQSAIILQSESRPLCTRCKEADLQTSDRYVHSTMAEWLLTLGQKCPGCEFIRHALINYQHSKDGITKYWREKTEEEMNRFLDSKIVFTLTEVSNKVVDISLVFGSERLHRASVRVFGTRLKPSSTDRIQPADDFASWTVASHATETLGLARSWLEHCLQHHGGLCTTANQVPLPTRLIYVSSDPDEPLRLCSTRGQKGQHCALSYVWGSGNTFTTTAFNIHDRIEGFREDRLPKAVRDAVWLTRNLGFHWLWVDALCIIQGDVEDWTHESTLMAEVYGRAVLTISADLVTDASSEILQSRKPVQRFDVSTEKDWSLYLIGEEHTWDLMCVMPLYTRGWAFQERILSVRVLHLLDNYSAFECNTTLYREGIKGSEPYTDHALHQNLGHFAKHQIAHYFHDKTFATQGRSLDARIGMWNYMVQEMAVRQFTVESDRFPGVSGLASALGVPQLGPYLAGTWEYNPFVSMAWRPRWPQIRPPAYAAPSWSWAWTSRQLIWHWATWATDVPEDVLHAWSEWDRLCGPRLEKHRLRYSTSSDKGPVQEGSFLVISGLCRYIWIQKKDGPDIMDGSNDQNGRRASPPGARVFLDTNPAKNHITSFCPSRASTSAPADAVEEGAKKNLCVQIARERKIPELNPKVLCLVLEQVEQEVEAFVRVGIYYFDADGAEKDEAWERKSCNLF